VVQADHASGFLNAQEQLMRDLVNLAIMIRGDGQVNPLTVVDGIDPPLSQS